MTPLKLALKSLIHYRWLNLAVLAGVALTSAILSGALVVGDSVKASLAQNSEARISEAEYALVGGDRYFTTGLADRVQAQLPQGSTVAPVLQTVGTVSAQSGGARANDVQFVGVEDRFWELSLGGNPPVYDGVEGIAINEALARRLGAEIGDSVLGRFEIPGVLSRDAPLSGASDQTNTMREEITHILGNEAFGRYNLNVEQIPQPSVFIPLSRLQEELEQVGRANVLLVTAPVSDFSVVAEAFEQSWNLEDVALEVRGVQEDSFFDVVTSRVFLDRQVGDAVLDLYPNSTGVLTYLVNSIHGPDGTTPYSMVAGVDPEVTEFLPNNMTVEDGVVVDWIREDIKATESESISLDFFVSSFGRDLTEASRSFNVVSVISENDPQVDDSWTPDFPTVKDAEDSSDWEPGMPIDQDRIRDKDEDWWDDYKATPKVFVTLEAAQEMWGNRFGDVTAVRIPADEYNAAEFEKNLKEKVSLSSFGLMPRNLREEAEHAVANSYDFGGLFAGMSFFLIIAALILTALVFLFGVEQRRNQIGLLLAMGMRKPQIRNLFMLEALILSVIGASVGLFLGIIYTQLALNGLGGAWSSAASGVEFIYDARSISLIISWVATVVLSLGVVFFAARAASKVQPVQLILGADSMALSVRQKPMLKTLSFWLAVIALLGGIICMVMPKSGPLMMQQLMFFTGGFLFVVAGLSVGMLILHYLQQQDFNISSLNRLGMTNAVRRRGRSLSVMALMASGVFMVTAINSLRLSGQTNAGDPDSGTGGYAWLGQSTLPIYEDLNTDAGREEWALDGEDGADWNIVQFRMSEGDDASCLNLNRAQQPRVLGVDPDKLAQKGAFFFPATAPLEEGSDPWELLKEPITDGENLVVRGMMDQATAQYALGNLGVGDRLQYTSSNGPDFEIEIAGLIDNSVLQGSVVIAEEAFVKLFPDDGGYRFFLMDTPDAEAEASEELAQSITRALEDRGMEMIPAWQRLNEFNAVQNTYLSIFSTLGGLGVLLGTVGLGIVVGRNILERQGQMGLLESVGFTRQALARMVVAEHGFLHGYGVILGVLAALVAVLPTVLGRSTGLPGGLLAVLITAILLGGLFFTWLSARWMLRTQLIESLRHE